MHEDYNFEPKFHFNDTDRPPLLRGKYCPKCGSLEIFTEYLQKCYFDGKLRPREDPMEPKTVKNLVWWCTDCNIKVKDPGFGKLPICPKCHSFNNIVQKEVKGG